MSSILEKLIGKPLHEVSDEELERILVQSRRPETREKKRATKRLGLTAEEVQRLLDKIDFDDLEV